MNGLVFVFLVAGIVGAVVLRRRLRDPESMLGRWYQERIKPRQRIFTTWFFLGTLVLWAVLFFAASEEDQAKSTRALKTFGKAFTAPKTPGKEPAINKDGIVKQ